MGLQVYAKKRNFGNTPEPKGKQVKPGKQLQFVVQRHHASRLHYDFRLEMDGVMKSWAVPKGPSMNPGDKRLAMMVEDHPFDYRTFEGIIPEGNYGAGTVEIWDKGTYHPIDSSNTANNEKELLKGLKKGNLKLMLNGKNLRGEFALVKIKSDAKKENAWLLIKHRDEYAIDKVYSIEDIPSLTKKHGEAFLTKKNTAKPAPGKKSSAVNAVKSGKSFRYSKKKRVTDFIKPMLAKETDAPFNDPEWIFEIKWDGYRAIAETGKALKLYSRNGISFLDRFETIAVDLQKLKSNLVLDGEIVAMNEQGNPDFQLLQNYDPAESVLTYYVFDILMKDGENIMNLPLTERKSILKKILKPSDSIRYSDHIDGEGIHLFNMMLKKELEGCMAKKANSIYSAGARTTNWLKIKTHKTQEVVIAGFTRPRNSRSFFGALVLGIYDGGQLIYTGHTGTGFNDSTLKTVFDQLQPLITEKSPFNEKVKTNMPVTWVEPKLVCTVKFSNRTTDGYLRHPVFMGIREDKEPLEATNEDTIKAAVTSGQNADKNDNNGSVMKKKTPSKKAASKAPLSKSEFVEKKINGKKVQLTNVNKIYFPKDKIKKGDIIEYYQSVSSHLLPYLKDRPQSLLRNPNGILDKGFFHKDAGDTAPEWVKSKKIYSDSSRKEIDYIICNDKATLAYLNNLGCIELNPWHSRISSLDKPDYLAIDLDPSPENSFDQVIDTALVVKEIFDRAGAASYCKTSGASGLHVYVPLGARYSYNDVKDFANIIAILVTEQLPKITSVVRPLQKRGNKIYVDFLQNRRGQTLASVYSVRPRNGATVSAPLQWNEVKRGLHPSRFDIISIPKRLSKMGDLFKAILGKGINMEKCLKKLKV